MWRMVFDLSSFSRVTPHSTRKLSRSDSTAIEVLTQNQPDSPDAYHPTQLDEPGVFYGCFEDNVLIAMAGTHIVSPDFSAAAIGNIFTRPDRRGQGLGTQVTQAVTSHLANNGIELIVLNVSLTNTPAIRCYEKVGFAPHCQYLEGIGRLTPPNQDILGQ
jgi:ribosomal protein S18 acetylase RimI-like enzyme